MKNVIVVDHPFVKDSLARLRDEKTQIGRFRFHSDQICHLLFADAIKGLRFRLETVKTPVGSAQVEKLDEEVIVVPVFRAGLAMLFGAIQLLPKSKVGFVGYARDEETAEAHEYYWKLPEVTRHSVLIVTDPMLATGGTILHMLRRFLKQGIKPKEMRVVCVVAAPEGIKAIHAEFPEVKIFCAAVDIRLNEKKYIVPGLGDYGDRYFGTKSFCLLILYPDSMLW
jgi:uracil phosphoribosyltransferase